MRLTGLTVCWQTVLFALGMSRLAMRRREVRRRAKKAFFIGVFAMFARWRVERIRKLKVLSVGLLGMAKRQLNQRRYCTLLFAVGVCETFKRCMTSGPPKGYVPEKKGKGSLDLVLLHVIDSWITIALQCSWQLDQRRHPT